MIHHQAGDVRGLLGQRQLVVYVGARGTGKSLLLTNVHDAFIESGMRVLRLDASEAKTANDLLHPIAGALGCTSDRLTSQRLEPGSRLRVLIDNCDALHDQAWFAPVQDQWRGLLGESEARGRVGFLLCGRPLFRRIAEGRGSPLIGIGSFLPSCPLTASDAASAFAIDDQLAGAIVSKTGGHPYLTRRLAEETGGAMAGLEGRYVDFAVQQRRYLVRLIEDHGSGARVVLTDMLNTPRVHSVSESALIARHFGSSRAFGQDTIDDLVASGLLMRDSDGLRLGATMLRTDRDLPKHLATPGLSLSDEPSHEHGDAASLLYRAENRLRQNVGLWLAEVEETWWPSRFPADLVREVELRRLAEAESAAPAAEPTHPLAYLTLSELIDSILEDRNWEQVFRIRSGMTRPAFLQAVAAVAAIRNKVAHNRPVTSEDLATLQMNLGRLEALLNVA